MVQGWFEKQSNKFQALTWPPPRQGSIIHGAWFIWYGGRTWEQTGPAAHIMVPHSTLHLQRSRGSPWLLHTISYYHWEENYLRLPVTSSLSPSVTFHRDVRWFKFNLHLQLAHRLHSGVECVTDGAPVLSSLMGLKQKFSSHICAHSAFLLSAHMLRWFTFVLNFSLYR